MTRAWADKPFKLIPSPAEPETNGISKEIVHIATEMALAHNMMVRNLNAIYQQCEGVSKPEDIKDFILFCQFSAEEIRTHHSFEEKYLFPQVAEYTGQKDIMEANLQQHHAFEEGMKHWDEYVIAATPETYDAKKVKQLVDDFGQILAVHLADEIPTLLGLEKYGPEGLVKAWNELNDKILGSLENKHKSLPVGLCANDRTYENGKHANWPPFPFFVPYLVKYYYFRKYKGSWRFSPCDAFGQPKELPFAPEI